MYDEIKINRGFSSEAQKVGSARDTLRSAVSQVLEVYEMMSHLTDGATFTNLETNCGIPTGDGAAVYNAWQYVALLFGAINTSVPANTALEGHFDALINRIQ